MTTILITLYSIAAIMGCLIACITVRDYARAVVTKDATGYCECALFERRIPKELILVVTCMSTAMAVMAVAGIITIF